MRPDCRDGGEGRGSKPCVFAQQKRPEPVFGSGRTKHCPWFHLNSPLEAGHFIPDNGGDRRGISAARLKSAALSLPRGLAPTVLSLLRRREKASFSQPFVVRSIARRAALVKSHFRKEGLDGFALRADAALHELRLAAAAPRERRVQLLCQRAQIAAALSDGVLPRTARAREHRAAPAAGLRHRVAEPAHAVAAHLVLEKQHVAAARIPRRDARKHALL